jgi:hypothetical protein
MEGLWSEVNQRERTGPATGLIALVARPLRVFAPFLTVGAAGCAVAAIFLLAQSGAGVQAFAEGRPGTAFTIPTTASEPLNIYAVDTPGGPPLDLECEMGPTSDALVGIHNGFAAKHNGRTLKPVANLTSAWRPGDTVTCTGQGFETVVLGHNDGLTHLLQGLLATIGAIGAGTMGLAGFAIRRHSRRR